jgi:hypothetical protein
MLATGARHRKLGAGFYTFLILLKKRRFALQTDVFTYDPYGIRTRVTAVKGRCLNHLTNGPLLKGIAAEGIEPPTSRV